MGCNPAPFQIGVLTMWQNIINKGLNLYRKAKDAVTALGCRVINKTKRYVAAVLFTFGITFGFLSPVHADVPAGVTTAITGAAADVATVGAAVILVIIGIKVWKWIQRAF